MINGKVIILCSAFLLAACGSTSSDKSYYQLPILSHSSQLKSSVPLERQIQLVAVNVADYFNGQGIVYQTSDVKFVMASNNLWAGSLQQQLQNALIENLNAELPHWLVTNHPLDQGSNTLVVNVTAFHGRYDGAVIVRGDWSFTKGKTVVTRAFDIQLSQNEDGYDDLVKELAKAWKQESMQIAKEINQLN